MARYVAENPLGEMDDLRMVSMDNCKALSKKQPAFIYRDDVLKKTLEICEKKGIEVVLEKVDDYYVLKNAKAEYNDKFYKSKRGK